MIRVRFHQPYANISVVGFTQLQGHCALHSPCTAMLRCLPKLPLSHACPITAAASDAADYWPTRPAIPLLLNGGFPTKTPIQGPL